MLYLLKKLLHDNISPYIKEQVRAEVGREFSEWVNDVSSRVLFDPLAYSARASAEELAAGVATINAVDIHGDVAEFGTMTGFTATILARSINECEKSLSNPISMYGIPSRNLDLFDSFVGLPESTAKEDLASPHLQGGIWAAGTCQGVTSDELRAMTAAHIMNERVTIYEGWFADTIGELPDDKRYALVHIDGDLYSSAMDVLEGLLSQRRLVPGCIVFFDDWNCNRASPEFGERKAWADCTRKYSIRYSDRGDYGLFGKSFFVHEYK